MITRESNYRISFRRHVAILVAAIGLSFCISTTSLAQASGSIADTVIDEQGGKIPGADLRLRSRGGAQFSTITDQNGLFAFKNLKPGAYLVEVKARGFSTFTSDQIFLARGKAEHLQLQLRVATINESVVVTATGTPQRADAQSEVF